MRQRTGCERRTEGREETKRNEGVGEVEEELEERKINVGRKKGGGKG